MSKIIVLDALLVASVWGLLAYFVSAFAAWDWGVWSDLAEWRLEDRIMWLIGVPIFGLAEGAIASKIFHR